MSFMLIHGMCRGWAQPTPQNCKELQGGKPLPISTLWGINPYLNGRSKAVHGP
mgnify:CR=1 FL=1